MLTTRKLRGTLEVQYSLAPPTPHFDTCDKAQQLQFTSALAGCPHLTGSYHTHLAVALAVCMHLSQTTALHMHLAASLAVHI